MNRCWRLYSEVLCIGIIKLVCVLLILIFHSFSCCGLLGYIYVHDVRALDCVNADRWIGFGYVFD
jgi:hypothetical protein